MKDEITGVAVLDTSGPYHWLYYVRAVAKIGELCVDDLPVLPEGAAQPEQRLPSWFPENRPWRYRVDGDTLHVHPSVLIRDFFHNEGQWSVKFVPAASADRRSIWRQLAAANLVLPKVAEKAERMASFGE